MGFVVHETFRQRWFDGNDAGKSAHIRKGQMTDYSKVLKNGEKAIYDLRDLFRRYGYKEFKAGKFEDYELYSDNKDFLSNDGILTFTDPNGHLMALKPDVTLSVAKDAEWHPGVTRKIYYDDEVYRMSSYSHDFREIMQTGIECMGDVDEYDECEVLILAARSLELISGNYVLDISHMAIVREILDELKLPPSEEKHVLHCLAEKNAHGIRRICAANGVPEEAEDKLIRLVRTYGDMDKVLPEISDMVSEEALDQLKCVRDVLEAEDLARNVRFDFSVVNEMGYYNGIMFDGFVEGLSKPVIAGGRYDNLMKRMGKKCGAVGFSVSVDALERLTPPAEKNDVDVLMIYDGDADIEALSRESSRLRSEGKTVLAERGIPEKLTYGEIVRFKDGELKKISADDLE